MGFDYLRIRDKVAEPKIEQFGLPGYMLLPGQSIGEPWESHLDNDVEIPVLCLQTTFTKADNNGTVVEKDDVMFLVSTQGIANEPTLADRIVVDCVEYQIIRIDPLKPGPVVVLWKVHARK